MDKKVLIGMLTDIKQRLCIKDGQLCDNYSVCSCCNNWKCDSIRAMERAIKFIQDNMKTIN